MFIAFGIIFLPFLYLRYLAPSSPQSEEARRARKERMTPSWVKNMGSKRLVRLFGLGLMAYITLQVVVPILMRSSIQERLSVTNRNTVIAAEAFLVPYNAIFQFIEDIVLVRVNYAMARKDHQLTNELVHLGLFGSFLSGIVAAVVGTILGVIPPSLAGLTNPGAAADEALYPGCDLLQLLSKQQLAYWLVKVWAIPGTQVGLVLTGFMLGAMELSTVGWLGSISLSLILIVWFTSINGASNPLLVLAGAEFAAAWVLPILSILYLVGPLGADLRLHTGVHLQLHKMKSYWKDLRENSEPGLTEQRNAYDEINHEAGGVEAETEEKETLPDSRVVESGEPGETAGGGEALAPPPPAPQSTKALLKEGLKIMFMDVAIQCCISLSIYLALANNAAEGYQLTALQSALPTYGIGKYCA